MSNHIESYTNTTVGIIPEHTPEAYKDISSMGFNTVRMYLHYLMFESDTLPYQYKESGFAWLDTEIAEAKKNNIRLLLNFHIPQGGYLSKCAGTLFDNKNDEQNRLIALWRYIAKRYNNEEGVAGYDPVNEPCLRFNQTEENTYEELNTFYSKLIKTIREVDNHHMLSLEPSKRYTKNGVMYTIENWKNLFKAEDNNWNIQYHDYTPGWYTFQGMTGNPMNDEYYWPNSHILLYGGKDVYAYTIRKEVADITTSIWVQKKIYWNAKDTEFVRNTYWVALKFVNGINTCVTVDNIKINDYFSNNTIDYTWQFNFDKESTNATFKVFSSTDNNNNLLYGNYGVDNTFGWKMTINGNATIVLDHPFLPIEGHIYVITMDLKIVSATNEVAFIVDVHNNSWAYGAGYEELDISTKSIQTLEAFFGVPVFIGEFGANFRMFENNKGGENWVTDIIETFVKYKLSYNYHTYHEQCFGLYNTSKTLAPGEGRMELLYNAFMESVKETPVLDGVYNDSDWYDNESGCSGIIIITFAIIFLIY
ncbi:hypothetical protein EIN_507210 [Entamoeba invadens IP1]|uniref:Glycoside hydrolase family 5 domain-containing protein n=1 Tax=Entamoeba invadens IP1 TaxID=370355 RepID=A0A0A1UCF9_ENTIV|nr:hypothetical protein EIN_507210 [Entamoeba invadens IP1]ELP92840.1 hypothetical protein EIN_507210 [Entamoeba invadens IP1]|eukprot:XP_004259611.1 hypothetical protein EIN_507210 [Entamoeba invadens IP1]